MDRMEDLWSVGIPPAVAARLQARRDWLQHLFRLELDRHARIASGRVSAFEAACGMTAKQLPPGSTLKQLVNKFTAERTRLLMSERAEIESLHALQAA